MNRLIAAKAAGRKSSTAENYTAVRNSFLGFLESKGARRVTLAKLNAELMEAYCAWLEKRGCGRNTVSFYMRILRAAYARAVEDGLTKDNAPFRRVYTGNAATVKRALPLETVRRISRLDLSGNPRLDFARDMFMMSFYLRGMSFVDMAFLRKADLTDGRLIYRRRKTGKPLLIEWTEEMRDIAAKYPRGGSKYLLPIIRNEGSDEAEWASYKNAIRNVNNGLKKVGKRVLAELPLTTYVARHTWATCADRSGVPLTVISGALGHGDMKTTQIYLASIDSPEIDRANRRLLDLLK